MERYNEIMAAVKVLNRLRMEVYARDECGGPAWVKLFHAGQHLMEQAHAELLG